MITLLYHYWNDMHMGRACVSIATSTDRKVTHMHAANVTQWSRESIRLNGDIELELTRFDSIRER